VARLSRVPLSGLEAGERALEPKTERYLCDVLRLRAGDRFLAFDPDAQLEADAELVETGSARIACALRAVRPASRVLDTGIVLVQALGKGDKTEQVVRSATALGVAEIHLVESARSVARAGERSDTKRARLASIALDAARQSGRGDVPKIVGPHALLRELDAWRGASAIKLCLVPGASETLRSLTREWSVGSAIGLLIGPEGGFAPEELAAAEAVGFRAASFGALVLRTEVAGVAALGALLLLAEA
jgi:16S rRNA (uracil1498-N3)-methyltransferase